MKRCCQLPFMNNNACQICFNQYPIYLCKYKLLIFISRYHTSRIAFQVYNIYTSAIRSHIVLSRWPGPTPEFVCWPKVVLLLLSSSLSKIYYHTDDNTMIFLCTSYSSTYQSKFHLLLLYFLLTHLVCETPLHLASKNGHSDTVRTLVELGANINSREGLVSVISMIIALYLTYVCHLSGSLFPFTTLGWQDTLPLEIVERTQWHGKDAGCAGRCSFVRCYHYHYRYSIMNVYEEFRCIFFFQKWLFDGLL